MEAVMKDIETSLNERYQKYGGNRNSDAATENPGEHVLEADVVDADEPKKDDSTTA